MIGHKWCVGLPSVYYPLYSVLQYFRPEALAVPVMTHIYMNCNELQHQSHYIEEERAGERVCVWVVRCLKEREREKNVCDCETS